MIKDVLRSMIADGTRSYHRLYVVMGMAQQATLATGRPTEGYWDHCKLIYTKGRSTMISLMSKSAPYWSAGTEAIGLPGIMHSCSLPPSFRPDP